MPAGAGAGRLRRGWRDRRRERRAGAAARRRAGPHATGDRTATRGQPDGAASQRARSCVTATLYNATIAVRALSCAAARYFTQADSRCGRSQARLRSLADSSGSRCRARPRRPPGRRPDAQPTRPNIVLIFPDNLGWGEVGVYGSVRGVLDAAHRQARGRGHPAQQLQRRVLVHGLARGAADRPLRDSHRRDAGRRHHAVGSDDRRGAEVRSATRRRSSASGTSAATRRKASASRRTRASTSTTAFRARATKRRRRLANGSTTPGTSFIWEGKAGEPSRNVKPFDLDTRRTVDREAAQNAASRSWSATSSATHAVLPLLPDDADPLPDARASGLRRQDRRRRHRRRDGRRRLQRRPRARRDRSARHRAQHDRVLVHRQRRRDSGGRGAARRARGAASTTR